MSSTYPLYLFTDSDQPARGYGVRCRSVIPRYSLVCEYDGELLSSDQAEKRELEYTKWGPSIGCYMFYFQVQGALYCRDGTFGGNAFAVHMNHSKKKANLYAKVIMKGAVPHLCFFAKSRIKADKELLVDYGDRSKESVESFPWLKE